MKKEEIPTTAELCRDPRRAAYMIEWRDRCMEKLQEAIKGYEEERTLLGSLLFCALCRAAEVKGENRFGELVLGKAEVASMIGRWHCEVQDGEDAYILRFSPRGGREKGGEGCDAQNSPEA